MSDPIRIYVGTDQRMEKAEKVLEHSIRKHATAPVDITWMRGGDPGWKGGTAGEFAEGLVDWNIGRQRGLPYQGFGWATEFTCFRYAIPEMAGKEGRAIYLDVDMMLLSDIKELWEQEMEGKALMAISHKRFDVILYDCGHPYWKSPDWCVWESQLRSSGNIGVPYRNAIITRGQLGILSPLWDCCDGAGFEAGRTKLYHFTNMHTQPWRPWPEVLNYDARPHPHPQGVEMFWELHREANESVRQTA